VRKKRKGNTTACANKKKKKIPKGHMNTKVWAAAVVSKRSRDPHINKEGKKEEHRKLLVS